MWGAATAWLFKSMVGRHTNFAYFVLSEEIAVIVLLNFTVPTVKKMPCSNQITYITSRAEIMCPTTMYFNNPDWLLHEASSTRKLGWNFNFPRFLPPFHGFLCKFAFECSYVSEAPLWNCLSFSHSLTKVLLLVSFIIHTKRL